MYTTTYNVDMKKPRMTAKQLSHLGSLLWMEYKPSELAEEIECATDTIYKSYIPAGCPNRRDDEGNIWIVGTEFAAWARKMFIRANARTTDMGRDQAWCMRCKHPVDVTELVARAVKPGVEQISGTCSECGVKVNRLRRA